MGRLSEASAYVFKFSSPSVPAITVSMNTVTSEVLSSAIDAYSDLSVEYAAAFENAIVIRDAVSKRLENDLTVDAAGMTEKGVNLASNYFVPNKKSDDVYSLAAEGKNTFSVSNVSAIISGYNKIYSNVCLKDNSSEVAFVTEYGDSVVYDTQSVTISSAGDFDGIFIKDVPNAIGTEATYTQYTTTEVSSTFVNTSAYGMKFEKGEVTSGVTAKWVVKEGNISIAYADNPTSSWTIISE